MAPLGLQLIAVLALLLSGVARAGGSPATDPMQDRIDAGPKSWAFSAPREPEIPSVRNVGCCKSPIDRFLLAKLEAKGLHPSPPADKRTLIRRAYFDLIGLPPKPQEVEAFVNDNTPGAFAKVVDRLLASPQYGQRWARHWLDLVRYTDSFDARGVGSAGDIKYAWRYRDWVVDAFNRDLPYDRFVMQQIAGDLLMKEYPDQFGPDGIVATTMYVMGNWPGGDADREKMMTDIADDQVDVTSRVFLGVTLACARCHDHKFDPFTQKDYYGLAGIFFSTHFLPSPGSPASGAPLVTTPIATPRQVQFSKEYASRVASLQKKLDDATDQQYRALARSLVPKTGEYLLAFADAEGGSKQGADRLVQIAAERHLDPAVLARWAAYVEPSLHATPVRKLFTRATRNAAGLQGVDEWSGADGRPDPCVIANNTDHPVSFSTLTIPANSISVHPGPQTGVGMGWTSPISGTVRIRGRVADADPNCGDGIDWRIERSRGNALETLASGAFPNGGTQDFAAGEGHQQLESLDVAPGDVLQVVVYPKGDYSCDSTIIEFEIAETGGEHRTWSPRKDVLPDLLPQDPHRDASGRANVWQFFEAGEEKPVSIIPRDSRLARFLAPGAPRAAIADEVTAVLLELDHETNTNNASFSSPTPRRGIAAPGAAPVFNDSDRRVAPVPVRADQSESSARAPEPGRRGNAGSDPNDPSRALPRRGAEIDVVTGPATEPSRVIATGADAKLYRDLLDPHGPFWGAVRADGAALPAEANAAIAPLAAELKKLKDHPPAPLADADALIEGGVPQSRYAGIHDCPVMARGRYDRPGEIVPRGFPGLLAGDGPPPRMHDSGRLELARWIASPDNPMTAKVMVNRIWQHHFGQGIVRTPNNFGKLGVPPTHPELLDYLARRFIESGWSIKAMHRMIMLSSTYQQSSEADPQSLAADPDNELFGRMNRQRLEAEPFRDTLLAVGGSLDLTPGGPAFRDMQVPRRTLYLMTIRSDRSNYRMLFDAADPTAIVDQRIDSTVAPQALFLMNDPFVLDRAKALAARVQREGPPTDAARIDWLYRLLYARPATERETQIGLAMLRGRGGQAWTPYCQVLLCANEFVYVD